MTTIVIVGIVLALLFDFLNGMNDAANSIATVVSTRVLPPLLAVAWAALFNLVGAFGFGVSVATTIGKGIVDPATVTPQLVVAALIGAIIWTHFCTRAGLPISVSHALIGGIAGATLIHSGPHDLYAAGLLKVGVFIFLSPLIGMLFGALLMVGSMWWLRNWEKSRAERLSRRMQLASSAVYALSHGTNDAQKTMGIIAVLLFSVRLYGDQFLVPSWVIVACTLAISLGTLTGGWSVIKTMGMKLTKLRPIGGFAAETGGGLTILLVSMFGIPVSTTHTITGSIAGVGAVTNVGAVRWGMAKNIVWAWILTIPVSALVGALSYWGYSRIAGWF